MINEVKKISILRFLTPFLWACNIGAHGGGGGGTSFTPSIDFKKCNKSIKHENREPPRFSHNPKYPLKRI
jgi:hypothetical protein